MASAGQLSPADSPVRVTRWPSERPLWLLILLISIGAWVFLTVSIVGLIYAVLFGVLFFLGQIAFIAHLRGNAVRLGPDQMPALHERVSEIAARLGMARPPVAYVLQEGGALNALATRFLRTDFIVLYSDLLDACGANEEARDFIVAHELGHLRAGHLSARWFLMPGILVPFLGMAYSRACEYTSDRYGMAAARDRERALDGLTILAAGAKHGPSLNRRALVAQRVDLNTVWMNIGQWLSTHPTIAHRLAALEPSLASPAHTGRGPAFAAAAVVIACFLIVPIGGTLALVSLLAPLNKAIQERAQASLGDGLATAGEDGAVLPDVSALGAGLGAEVEAEIQSLVSAVESHRSELGSLPESADQVYATWLRLNPGAEEPQDPYAQARYEYLVEGDRFAIWSTGQDLESEDDDIVYVSSAPAPETDAAAEPEAPSAPAQP